MKKKILLIALCLLISSYIPARAIQTKSTDYVVVTEEQVKDTIETPAETNLQSKTDNKSIAGYNVISDIGSYYKIKKQNKLGVIDKNGNIILAPVFQRIDIVNIDGQECFAAKTDGKYRFYYNTGKLIPDDKIYPVVQNTSVLLARDLKPLFKTAAIHKGVLYTKNQPDTDNSKFVYEIKEIPVIKNKNVQTAHIEKKAEEVVKASDLQSVIDDELNIFTVGKKQFYVLQEGKKFGIADNKGNIIIPPKYDIFFLKKPCKHFRNPVFVVSANNLYSLYDINGKLLAEQIFDRINVYRNGKIYTYNVENGKGVLKVNNKELGYFTLTDKGYKYTSKSKLSVIKPHIVNNLILTLLNI